jgi:hypothetical protein
MIRNMGLIVSTMKNIMRGVEFIGVYKGGGKVRDAVRGVIIDSGCVTESLMVFYLGGTIWKRSGRKKILEKVLKENVIVQRYSKMKFHLIKIFDRVVSISTEELERKIEYTKIYRTWKEEVLRQEN